ncbi:MAG: hypothetical protein V2A79_07840 [Planctomycetota bacterium]
MTLLALGWGVWRASAATWVCDDAFISFRYARNLVEGLGLVFNAGERVEGYTNFLWTLWVALGLRLGFQAEPWAGFWGIVCYGGAIVLLSMIHFRLRGRLGHAGWALPIAALAGALHQDWQIYATSGLETSCFTVLLLVGYLLVVMAQGRRPHLAVAGIAFGLAASTRPDGVLPAVVAGLYVLWRSPSRLRCGLVYTGTFLAIWVPFLVWRVWYYGDIVPNAYYAKSANLAWYGQGWHYVALYFRRYGVLLAGPVLLIFAAAKLRFMPHNRAKPIASFLLPEAVLAAAIAFSYTFYVLRVGGDFMFARLLIPVTPFYLLLLDFGLISSSVLHTGWRLGIAVVLVAGLVVSKCPIPGRELRYGIANEPVYYGPELRAFLDRRAEVLARYFQGLPVRIGFFGTQAREVYRARLPMAIDCAPGLTDRFIARHVLVKRGRVGHEKLAPVPYLIDVRKLHFAFFEYADKILPLNDYVPDVWVVLDQIEGRVLHWDPVVMEVLRERGAIFVWGVRPSSAINLGALHERGAIFDDYPALLDRYIAGLDERSQDVVAGDFAKFQRFYFDHVQDPLREAAFWRKIEGRSD